MRHLTAFFIASLLACSGSSQGPTPTPTPRPTQVAESPLTRTLDQHIEQFGKVRGESHRFSGHVYIVRKGEVIYDRGFGMADRKASTTNTADTSFRIGSVTKQFTATAIYLLEKQGKLKLSDSVATHLAGYPKPAGDQVTIQHLLTHTGGVPSYTSDEEVMARRSEAMTTAELVATFKDKPLEFAPGEKFAYSNSGYVLLGAIIEKVSGKSYADFMQEAVFAPAGLDSTVVGDAPTAKDRALGYQIAAGDKVEPADPIDMSVPHAAGAIRSTSRDLARWHAALAEGSVIDQATQARMQETTKVSENDGADATSSYGAGWSIVEDKKLGKRIVRHGGGIDGFGTSYVRVPADDVVIVVWTNKPGSASPAKSALLAVYGKPLEPYEEKAIVALDAAAIARVAGTYALTEKSAADALAAGLPEENLETIRTIEVKAAGETIEVKPATQPAIPFEAESPSAFAFPAAGIRLEFEFGSDGKSAKATAVTLKQGPLSLRLERKE